MDMVTKPMLKCIQHDVHFVNYCPIKSKIDDKAKGGGGVGLSLGCIQCVLSFCKVV